MYNNSKLLLTFIFLNTCIVFIISYTLFTTHFSSINTQNKTIKSTNQCKFVGGNEFFNPMYNYGFNSQYQQCSDSLYANVYKQYHKYDYTNNYATIFEQWMSSKDLRILKTQNALPLLFKSAVGYWEYKLTDYTKPRIRKHSKTHLETFINPNNSVLWIIHRPFSHCNGININTETLNLIDSIMNKSQHFIIDMCTPYDFIYSNKFEEF
eukprot:251719_1